MCLKEINTHTSGGSAQTPRLLQFSFKVTGSFAALTLVAPHSRGGRRGRGREAWVLPVAGVPPLLWCHKSSPSLPMAAVWPWRPRALPAH